MNTLVLGGGRRIQLEDIARISHTQIQVCLDESAAQRIDTNFSSSCQNHKEAKPEELNLKISDKQAKQLTFDEVSIIRAALFCRLSSLIAGRTPVRGSTLNILLTLLNESITPIISGESSNGEDVALFLCGEGHALLRSGEVITAEAFLSKFNYRILTVEVKAFVGYPFSSIGVACLACYGSMQLIRTIDCITALSCEAIGCKADSFDSVAFETYRPHRGQMLSTSNIKNLLEGSKTTSFNPAGAKSLSALLSSPQVTGPCQESIYATAKALEIELNSCEALPLDYSKGSVFDGTVATLARKTLQSSIETLTLSSKDRVSLLLSNESAPQLSTVDSPLKDIRSLSNMLVLEASTALKVFSDIELADSVKSASVSSSEPVEQAEGNSRGGKPQSDDSKLTPEQLAKVEAKRKAKAEKAAAKAAEKEKRKAGLVLGAGTSQIRAILSSSSSETHLQRLLNPWNHDEGSFANQCAKIVDALNVGGKRKPKIPKGARDFTPDQMRVREQAFGTIRQVFKRHGGVEIDTPVFELKEVLTGKYGEDSKLIYDLADQGGELLSLRYDLTVPFARFLALNSVGNIKRYHIAKVYRRDNPVLSKGRYREFYQCDFDIAGSYSPMVPDAEAITVATEILAELPVGDFIVKINHRKILDSIFEICGVPPEKFRPICSAVDKLDKSPWEEVKREMVEDKGLSEEAADRIGKFVLNTGKPFELWEELSAKNIFGDHVAAKQAMDEMKLLFQYLEAMGSLKYISFDLSLARGLDYYTGVIYEVVLTDGTSQVGSIAAGGRYDNLVGMFSVSNVQTPCVGISIGIERVFTIMERKAEQMKLLQASTIQVFIASIGPNLMFDRMRIARILWQANISAEYSHLENPKFKRQLDDTLERGIPFMVVFGSDEVEKGVVKVKDMRAHSEVELSVDDIVSYLISQGCAIVNSGTDRNFIEALKSFKPSSTSSSVTAVASEQS